MLTPPVWLASRGAAMAPGLCGGVLTVYLGFTALGADVLLPLKIEGRLVTCGNLPFQASLLGLDPAGPIGTAATLALLGLWAGVYAAGLASAGFNANDSRMIHLLPSSCSVSCC